MTHKTLYLALLFLLAHSLALAARKPNVIVIYTDDQGSVDTHLYGAKDLVTPHMDALAKAGVRFTQMYAPAPVCSPSRAGLLTGRYPKRAGMANNAPSGKGGAGMPASQVTMAEMFKRGGYATAHIGKWHLGYTPETMPNAQGFDYSFGHMGGCIDNYSHFFYWQGPNRHDLWRNGKEIHKPGEFFGDLMVQEAAVFIEKNREKPMFIYFAINMPHYPYQGDEKWLDHYRDLKYPRNLYAAFMSTIDDRIGQLIAAVEKQGLTDDTIVILQSDHGHSIEERAHRGGGSAGPYRGAKFSLYEGGIRVPSIIKWPGRVPVGEVRDQVVHGCDWLPTLATMCNVDVLEKDIDGKDISAVIESADAPSPHNVLHWTIGRNWAVREGDWKLIGGKKPELYNVTKDIGERSNVADQHPEIRQRLQQHHNDWAKSLRR
ncbi:MAG: sulfatase-like hydrolase/transferase [Pirellulales bacterium]|nr:sulfatase-like hydrolase/transferase [Pirellulales bacterium]